MIFRTLFFLVVNFGALALGALLMGGSPAENEWYNSLNKAPWTPPGWVFGFAWTVIMVCFSLYMARIFIEFKGKLLRQLMLLFSLQFLTNVLWNPLFFYWHLVLPALLVLSLLIVILVIIHLNFSASKKFNNFLIAPYFLWLLIAFSLNLYVLMLN
jgi:tryptophan-rich sensory protein